MNTRYNLFLVRWENGTFSFHYGTGSRPLVQILDYLSDPNGAEVRAIPPRLSGILCFNQPKPGESFRLEPTEQYLNVEGLWSICDKQLWPTDDPTVPQSIHD